MTYRKQCATALVVIVVLLIACARTTETPEAPSQGSASWEPGEWGFNAELVPWPAPPNESVTLRAIATIDDDDRSFPGTVSYRLVSATATGDWSPMSKVGSDQGNVIFESTVKLPAEKVGIHFRVSGAADGSTHEFTDWSVVPQ